MGNTGEEGAGGEVILWEESGRGRGSGLRTAQPCNSPTHSYSQLFVSITTNHCYLSLYQDFHIKLASPNYPHNPSVCPCRVKTQAKMWNSTKVYGICLEHFTTAQYSLWALAMTRYYLLGFVPKPKYRWSRYCLLVSQVSQVIGSTMFWRGLRKMATYRHSCHYVNNIDHLYWCTRYCPFQSRMKAKFYFILELYNNLLQILTIIA